MNHVENRNRAANRNREENRKNIENIGYDSLEIDRQTVEQLIVQVLKEQLGPVLKEKTGLGRNGKPGQMPDDGAQSCEGCSEQRMEYRDEADGVIQLEVPRIKVRPEDRLDTGCDKDRVYTRDLFSLKESPRLGCGIMEMEQTTFDWHLEYDEIDLVIDGFLTIIKNGKCVTAGPGEVILIPKGSAIQFSVPGKARFLYVTYPADWAGQSA